MMHGGEGVLNKFASSIQNVQKKFLFITPYSYQIDKSDYLCVMNYSEAFPAFGHKGHMLPMF